MRARDATVQLPTTELNADTTGNDVALAYVLSVGAPRAQVFPPDAYSVVSPRTSKLSLGPHVRLCGRASAGDDAVAGFQWQVVASVSDPTLNEAPTTAVDAVGAALFARGVIGTNRTVVDLVAAGQLRGLIASEPARSGLNGGPFVGFDLGIGQQVVLDSVLGGSGDVMTHELEGT